MKFYIISIIISTSICSFAQDTTSLFQNKDVELIDNSIIECIYKYTTITPIDSTSPLPTSKYVKSATVLNNKVVEEYYTILQTNGVTSKFEDYNNYQRDSIVLCSQSKLTSEFIKTLDLKYMIKVKNMFTSTIFSNYPPGKITVLDEIAPNDYIYEEPQINHDWKISEDTTTICGYLCQKATTHFAGRQWIAWFSSEIPISAGPWKMKDLPGLILRLFDSSGIHSFETVSLRQSKYPIFIRESKQSIKTSKKFFLSHHRKIESAERPVEHISQEGITSVVSQERGSEIIFLNGKRVKLRRSTIYSPLEFE